MPLVRYGEEVANDWVHHTGEGEVPLAGRMTLPLDGYLAARARGDHGNLELGVRLQPEDDPARLEDYLADLALIEISFPKYTDGRGYSLAQVLRRRLGYRGELRAVGQVLRDQIFYMHRSGFDAFETQRAGLSDVLEALREYSAVYQPAADGAGAAFRLRHGKTS